MSADCETELVRALGYEFGARTLDSVGQEAALAECLQATRRLVASAPEGECARLPRCADADDQKFLEAALAARADLLITKDHALLRLGRPGRGGRQALPFRIVAPEGFAKLEGKT